MLWFTTEFDNNLSFKVVIFCYFFLCTIDLIPGTLMEFNLNIEMKLQQQQILLNKDKH
jgi:hypothetical protein